MTDTHLPPKMSDERLASEFDEWIIPILHRQARDFRQSTDSLDNLLGHRLSDLITEARRARESERSLRAKLEVREVTDRIRQPVETQPLSTEMNALFMELCPDGGEVYIDRYLGAEVFKLRAELAARDAEVARYKEVVQQVWENTHSEEELWALACEALNPDGCPDPELPHAALHALHPEAGS